MITVPSGQGGVVSVALNPDGTRGFVIVEGWGLGRFDLAAGHATDANLAAYGSVRCSADGAHVAFPTQSWGMDPQLAVVPAGGGPTKRALGRFADIGRVRPLSDGSFLVTARVGRGDDDSAACAGMQVWPDGRVREVWRLTPGPRPIGRSLLPLEFVSPHRVNDRTDFLPEPMTGVTTDWQFVTTVTDLRTGGVVRTIDNRASWSAEPDVSGAAEPDGVWWMPAAGTAAVMVMVMVVVLAGGLVWRPYRRRGRGR